MLGLQANNLTAGVFEFPQESSRQEIFLKKSSFIGLIDDRKEGRLHKNAEKKLKTLYSIGRQE